MQYFKLYFLCLFVFAMALMSALPLPVAAVTACDHVSVTLIGECWQRMGPFVTQSTAWNRLRQAESQGYGVSGVFPCYGNYGRGYCFKVFYPC